MATTFNRLKLGAGGQILHISISNDGVTKVISTDAGGAYVWNNSTSQWDQLVVPSRLPAGDFTDEVIMGGCYAIAVAPSDSTRIYMMGIKSNMIGGAFPADFYVSSNSGATFTKAAGWTQIANLNPNADSNKLHGPKIAVDPVNPDVCIVTSDANGAFITTNGGTTFTAPTGLPTTTGTSHKGICFDPSSTVSGSPSRTQGVYVHSYGTAGVYKSTNGGGSFSLVAGGPSSCGHGKCGIDGAYYVITTNTNNLWRLVGSTWTDITPAVSWNIGNEGAVCPSLTNAATLYVSDDGGAMYYSTNANTGTPTWSTRTDPGRTATDIPWLAVTRENHMTSGAWVMDPLTADKIWFCSGIGVFYTTAPKTAVLVPWISQSKGIEELVTNQIVSPPNGYPLIANWDRPVFTITDPETYPSSHGPNYDIAVNQAFGVDYATADPSFCVVLANQYANDSSYSTDKGVTWTRFANQHETYANNRGGGAIATSSATCTLIVQANQGDVYYTRDNGATAWTKITSTNWGNNVADSGTHTITAMGVGTAGVVRVTVANVGTLVTGQEIHFDAVSGTGGYAALGYGTYVVTKISSTQFDCAGTTAGGTFTSGECRRVTGWNDAAYLARVNICADRVSADTFYLMNSGAPDNANFGGGFFKVTFPAGVLTCVRQSLPSFLNLSSYNVKMVASPNNAGHLLFTAGDGQSHTSGIQYSRDGGATWTKVANSQQTRAIGFGKIKSGNDYPSVYIVGGLVGGGGYGSQEYGIYRSDSSAAAWAANTQTWTFLEDFPLDSVSQIKTIAGDADTWGRGYIGTPCGGCFYFTEGGGGGPSVTKARSLRLRLHG